MFDFKRKKVLITGASSGLGAQLALKLADSGAVVTLVARRRNELSKLCQRIKKKGGRAKYFCCDVADYNRVAKTSKLAGTQDVAFLNAGIPSGQLVQNLKAAEVRRVMDVNFLGVVNWLEPLLASMQKKNSGTIVITSSLAAWRGLPASASYAASKAALSTFIESAQIDLLATKVKIIHLLPYFMITQMSGSQKKNNKIWLTADRAAEIILEGVKKGKQDIIFPWHFRTLMYVFRLLPYSWYRGFFKIVRRGG